MLERRKAMVSGKLFTRQRHGIARLHKSLQEGLKQMLPCRRVSLQDRRFMDLDKRYNDLYENSKYGHFAEEHIIEIGSKTPPTNQVISCEVLGNKCTSMDEFHKLADPYMSN
jgi:hypothetical protein